MRPRHSVGAQPPRRSNPPIRISHPSNRECHVKFSKIPAIQSSLSHLRLQVVERRSNCLPAKRGARLFRFSKAFYYVYTTRFFVFFLLLLSFGGSPFYTTWRSPLRYLQGSKNTRSLLRYTTQRGGGCVVGPRGEGRKGKCSRYV